MSTERGASVGDYRAPLFLAWQLTNRCGARCLACCEESGPDSAWPGELSADEARDLAREAVVLGIPYAAFGGGEPLGVPHVWELLRLLSDGGVELKLETNGLPITEEKADFLKSIEVQCVQISVDGATREVFDAVRPSGDFAGVLAAIRRLVRRGIRPEFVFVPNRLNVHEIESAYELSVELGCRSFVTGPMMRLGRAARAWESLGLADEAWARAEQGLRERAARLGFPVKLSVYPWDILGEIKRRLKEPQAMLLVVPDGKVKLLNALPFAPADLRRQSLEAAWEAYKAAWASEEVSDFVGACSKDPSLLLHANETWAMGSWSARRLKLSR